MVFFDKSLSRLTEQCRKKVLPKNSDYKLFAKTREIRKFWIMKVALFIIFNPDSVGVKVEIIFRQEKRISLKICARVCDIKGRFSAKNYGWPFLWIWFDEIFIRSRFCDIFKNSIMHDIKRTWRASHFPIGPFYHHETWSCFPRTLWRRTGQYPIRDNKK